MNDSWKIIEELAKDANSMGMTWIDEEVDQKRFDDILKQIRQNVDKHSKYFKDEVTQGKESHERDCLDETECRQGEPPADAAGG